MNAIPQLFFDAMSLGGIYAMAALGIALIFGVMKLVNFAHGEYIAFCVFALIVPSNDAVAVMFLGKAPAILLIPLLLMVGAAIAVASEYCVFRHMRNATPVAMMISSFALGFVIQNVCLIGHRELLSAACQKTTRNHLQRRQLAPHGMRTTRVIPRLARL